jgi:hypothetical protein
VNRIDHVVYCRQRQLRLQHNVLMRMTSYRKGNNTYSPGSVSVMSASCVLVLIATTVFATPEFINTVPSTSRVSSAWRSLHMPEIGDKRGEEDEEGGERKRTAVKMEEERKERRRLGDAVRFE